MKIFVEGHSYDPKDVENVLPENRLLLSDGRVKIENVGYYRSPKCDDFVFFLPKVVLAPVKTGTGEETEDRAFCRFEDGRFSGGFRPEDLIDPETARSVDGEPLADDKKDFLYEFSVWIYRALARYRTRNPDGVAWSERNPGTGAFRRRYETHTLLDVILAMLRFRRENRDYVMFRVKEMHSGANRVDWRRTVAKSTAVVTDGMPVYLELRNRRKTVDWDEELLVIFHSILAYVGSKFGFDARSDLRFDLITGARFDRYLAGYGERRLRQIRYKYFSDRDLAMWRLCNAFFAKAHRTDVSGAHEEYLLAKDFERVFETIVDDLLGDGELDRFKELDDAKRIDHLYLDDSLTRQTDPGKIFYIADSKYYKRGNRLGIESIAKQFTYARDFLQLDLDLFLSGGEASEKVRKERKVLDEVGLVRDPDTEGYDVIPNFFVSATLPENLGYDDDGLVEHAVDGATASAEYRNIHFENRLFDRDTLILSHYDVNFLYLVKLYARADSATTDAWRKVVRDKFRKCIQAILKNRFEFRALMPYDGVSDEQARDFLRDHFPDIIGKVYAPYARIGGKKVYSLALEKPNAIVPDGTLSDEGFAARVRRAKAENDNALRVLKEAFYVVDVELGNDPTEALEAEAKAHPIPGMAVVGATDSVLVATGYRTGHPKAVKDSGWCPVDSTLCKDPLLVQSIVFPHTNQADAFKVRADLGIRGPMPAERVKADFPAFARIELPAASYYVWPVEP